MSSCKGDVMAYNARSLTQLQHNSHPQQQSYAGQMDVTFYEKIPPKTEMVIGSWYFDEFGNPTREIKARD
jgi:hypothetical protein